MKRVLTVAMAVTASVGTLTRCTPEPPPDTLSGLMMLTSQIAGAGVNITPVSGHTHELAFLGLFGGTAGFYVSLRTQPSSDVTMGTLSISPAAEAMLLPGAATALTFTPSNWSTAQLVAMFGMPDAGPTYMDGDQALTISLGSVTSQDQLYNGITLPVIASSNDDRDRQIYETGAYDGNFGGMLGIAGADFRCNNDAAKPVLPASATYKALIVDGVSRVASATANQGDGQVDWVLKSGYVYRQAATPANLIVAFGGRTIFPFGSNPTPCAASTQNLTNAWGAASFAWTGLLCDWTTDAANNCASWTNNTGVSNGRRGNAGVTGPLSIASPINTCNLPQILLCVQQ